MIVLGLSGDSVWALNPPVSKLHGKNSAAQTTPRFGASLALSDRWLVAGEPENDDKGADAGAVHVFDAVTCRYLRKLTAADASAGARFGAAVSVHGNLLVVGAPGDNGARGAAYLFDLAKGRQLFSLRAADGAAADEFGAAVAANAGVVVVGAPKDDGSGGETGAVYLFDAKTGAETLKIVSPANGAMDNFGVSLAVDGDLCLIGASGEDNTGGVGTLEGAAYLFSIPGGTQIHRYTPSFFNDGDRFGESVALDGGLAMIGAPFGDFGFSDMGLVFRFNIFTGLQVGFFFAEVPAADDLFGASVAVCRNLIAVGVPGDDDADAEAGSVQLFDVNSSSANRPLATITVSDGISGDDLGRRVALCGNQLAVSAPEVDDAGMASGAVYVFKQLAGPLPLTRVAVKRDFAPGLAGQTFSTFTAAQINNDGEVVFCASAGKVKGTWDTFGASPRLDDSLRAGTDLGGGLSAAKVLPPILSRSDGALHEAILKGTGVSRTNNRALFFGAGDTLTPLLRTGDAPAPFAGGTVSRFFQSASSRQTAAGFATVVGLGLAPGVVAKTDDSGILCVDDTGGVLASLREGGPSVGGAPNYGQFSRVSFPDDFLVYSAALQSAPGDNQAVFRFNPLNVAQHDIVARRGDTPPLQGPGVAHGAFLGETNNISEDSIYRGTLTGVGVTAANNEAIWRENLFEIVRKGNAVPGMAAGVVWSRFLKFWAYQNQVLFLAKIKGPGISAKNDCGLWLSQEDDSIIPLIREGEPAPGCGAACVGTIQRVAANPYIFGTGNAYAVLVSLTKSSSRTNQALLVGTTDPNYTSMAMQVPREELRRPVTRLRKGTAYQSILGTTTAIRSLALLAEGVDSGGAGGKGIGQPMADDGTLVLQAVFDNRSVELLTGRP
ncbi:MAG: FG-GAP repeat protein [Akkermansiaceae bacterium]|nr:FG-GAP repeat protein [Akkermansiaceae bacterium]